jgi:hypothetical protein
MAMISSQQPPDRTPNLALSDLLKAGVFRGFELAGAAGIPHIGIAVSTSNWPGRRALTVALAGTLLCALVEQALRALSSSGGYASFVTFLT